MAVTKAEVVLDQAHGAFQSFLRQRHHVRRLELWRRGEQRKVENSSEHEIGGGVYTPRKITDEYTDLATRTPTPWAGLVVRSLSQMVYVDGFRRAGEKDNLPTYDVWRRNRMTSRQIALHEDTISHGLAFAVVMPGLDPLTGDKMPKIFTYSADKMAAFYDDEDDDEWPTFALWAEPAPKAPGEDFVWNCRLYDETAMHEFTIKGEQGMDRKDYTYIAPTEHPYPVPPVVRYANRMNLNGRATGEIEPVIPMLRRIDQTTFDRLIVQRFGAWKVRWISGLARPEDATEEQIEAMRLRVEDLLISESTDTKFGNLDASEIKPFLEGVTQDLSHLAAITQTPPHHMLGLSSNLQAEALAAAESGLGRKAVDFRILNGQSHEQLQRLLAYSIGDTQLASAHDIQTRWRDTESRSLVQTANALGIIATALKVPVEMLWERLPGWTDLDSERAKELIESGDAIDAILAEIAQDNAMAAAEAEAKIKGTGGSDNEKKPTK
jgi:hypothetical protein